MSPQDPRVELLKFAKPYEYVTAKDIEHMEPPPEMFTGFLPRGGVVGITAAPGCGKTWLALSMCHSFATGTPLLGKYEYCGEWLEQTPGEMPVTYKITNYWTDDEGNECEEEVEDERWVPTVHQEMRERPAPRALFVGSDASTFDYARQWNRLTAGQKVRDDAVRFLFQSPFMLDDISACNNLIRTAAGCDLIIFDTLSKMTRANQNDNSEMEEVFRNLRYIAERTNTTCVLLHHNSKRSEFNGGEDWRGAVAQIGALDCWLQLAPSKNNKYLIRGEWKKYRGITPEPFHYLMEVSDIKNAKLTFYEAGAAPKTYTINSEGTYVADPDILTDAIYKYIIANAGSHTIDEVAEATFQHCSLPSKGDRRKHRELVKSRLKNITEANPRALPGGGTIYKLPKTTDDHHEAGRWGYNEED